MENVGGQMNAFTSKEHTCYYVKCLSEHFNLGMDVLADMYLDSTFPVEEFAKEKGVILEEINMYEDTPDDLVHDIFAATMWPEHPYGKSIIGTVQTVTKLQRDEMYAYYQQAYVPEHTVLVVTGNVKHDDVIKQAENLLGALKGKWDKPELPLAVPQSGQKFVYKDIEQVHLCFGVPGLPGDHKDIYKMHILNNILGGGVSSRLFQEAREARGLTYSIYSFNGAMSAGGALVAYASTSPQKVEEVVKVMSEQMALLAAKGVTEAELRRAQSQIKGALLMGLENSSNVMSRLGKGETNYRKILSVDELVELIMAVNTEDVQNMAKQLFQKDKLVFTQVGAKEYDVDINSLL